MLTLIIVALGLLTGVAIAFLIKTMFELTRVDLVADNRFRAADEVHYFIEEMTNDFSIPLKNKFTIQHCYRVLEEYPTFDQMVRNWKLKTFDDFYPNLQMKLHQTFMECEGGIGR